MDITSGTQVVVMDTEGNIAGKGKFLRMKGNSPVVKECFGTGTVFLPEVTLVEVIDVKVV